MEKNKKRILITSISIILILSLVFMIDKKAKESIETVSIPVTGKVIVLDAGHGKPDEGAFLLHKENKQLTFYK